MRRNHLTTTTLLLAGLGLALVPSTAYAGASTVDIVREDRVVPGSGEFTRCSDGSSVAYTSTSYRAYTTWYRDGVAVRERRHLTFDGTLSRAGVAVPYTGVWNRDLDIVTGELRITGGQFRVDLPEGGTLVGAGVRADGNEFKGTGDRFLVDLCTALGAA